MMIARPMAEEDHLANLQKIFERLCKYDLKLNLNKSATSRKLLGFIVSQHEIEIDPSNIKAIAKMPVPKTEKEVRGFSRSY